MQPRHAVWTSILEPAYAGGKIFARTLPCRLATTSPLRISIPFQVALAQDTKPITHTAGLTKYYHNLCGAANLFNSHKKRVICLGKMTNNCHF